MHNIDSAPNLIRGRSKAREDRVAFVWQEGTLTAPLAHCSHQLWNPAGEVGRLLQRGERYLASGAHNGCSRFRCPVVQEVHR